MAQIRVNEISQNYAYSVGTASFATVALPITASWGPGFVDPSTVGMDREDVLERTSWQRFSATREGLEAFVAAYRGPASNYRIAKDYSYYQAMTLLTAGYDLLVCRLCPGTKAACELKVDDSRKLNITAKYPGTFGNNLIVKLQKVTNRTYWNLITYVKDTTTGVTTPVENLTFYFDLNNPQDNILHLSELESDFLDITVTGTILDTDTLQAVTSTLSGGTDTQSYSSDEDASAVLDRAIVNVKARFTLIGARGKSLSASNDILDAYNAAKAANALDVHDAAVLEYKEWLFYNVLDVYDLLKDKLTYNPNRIISPGWDDMNVTAIDGSIVTRLNQLSPLHCKLMEVGYYSRCAAIYLDIPQCLPRKSVYNESVLTDGKPDEAGYAQMLSRVETYALNWTEIAADEDLNSFLYPTHAALFAPWGQYCYTGLSKMCPASPSFLALMIERAMIKNQSIQYEWIMPTVRRHSLNIGKLDYTVSKKLLDEWQKLEGVGVNVITNIPDMGVSIWGNSTLFETPPATYQALANLSSRKLMNAVKDICYRCGLAITFQYNNEQAYSAFYAGVTPTLDNMKNAGAIEGYKISMAADINGVDRVNANTCIGVVTLYIHGVIQDINIDLIAMPAGAGLE